MNYTFAYGFVPDKPLDEILRERVVKKSRRNINRVNHTMRLENQPPQDRPCG